MATHVVVVLGSSQDAGLPQLGAVAANDLKALRNSEFERLGASLAIVSSNGEVTLIDASPDIRFQYNNLRRTYPQVEEALQATRKPIHSIILTHAHMGHYLGEFKVFFVAFLFDARIFIILVACRTCSSGQRRASPGRIYR
jgi:phosphoribosyl 1,2-cyclic phosphodiesterase